MKCNVLSKGFLIMWKKSLATRKLTVCYKIILKNIHFFQFSCHQNKNKKQKTKKKQLYGAAHKPTIKMFQNLASHLAVIRFIPQNMHRTGTLFGN